MVEEIYDNNYVNTLNNIGWRGSFTYRRKISWIIYDNNFMKIVNECTRATKTASTIIDYAIKIILMCQ